MTRNSYEAAGCLLWLLCGNSAFAQQPAATDELPTPGTRELTRLLAEHVRTLATDATPFITDERIARFRAALAAAPTAGQRQPIQDALARLLLNAGQVEAAVAEFAALRAELAKSNHPTIAERLVDLDSLMAIAWLRLGEQENCLAHHGPDSCLMPLRGGGVHQAQRGARNALALLDATLTARPNDYGARWLYNVAAMAVGDWPAKVPPDRLIPESAFASAHDFPRFFDVAPPLGIATVGLLGGVIADDLDRDGLVDLICSSWGPADALRIFQNGGDGTFTDRTDAAGVQGEGGGSNLVSLDYDNDGLLDLFLPRGGWQRAAGQLPNSLLHNRGGFTFEDVTIAAGVLTFAPTQTATVADFDGDGWVDLFVGNESTREVRAPCELWWNQRNGTFKNIAAAAGVAAELFVKGTSSGDFDNDGRPDLFLSVMNGANLLFRNEPAPAGSGTPIHFRDVSLAAGIGGPKLSFASWFFDFDNDGNEDLLCCSYVNLAHRQADDVGRLYLGLPTEAEPTALYHNRGDGTFEEIGAKVGLGSVILTMGCNFGDLDNDGWLDCVFGTGDPDLRTLIPNRALRNVDGKRFEDVTTAGGFGHLQKGHGVAFADFDNDGDQDVYEVLGGAYSGDVYNNVLLENPGFGNHWITIELVGHRSNRMGVGTRLAVTVTTADGSERTIRVTGGSGGSFGCSTLAQEIGLGNATAIRTIEAWWPASGLRQRFENIALDQRVRVDEESATLISAPTRRFDLSPGN